MSTTSIYLTNKDKRILRWLISIFKDELNLDVKNSSVIKYSLYNLKEYLESSNNIDKDKERLNYLDSLHSGESSLDQVVSNTFNTWFIKFYI